MTAKAACSRRLHAEPGCPTFVAQAQLAPRTAEESCTLKVTVEDEHFHPLTGSRSLLSSDAPPAVSCDARSTVSGNPDFSNAEATSSPLGEWLVFPKACNGRVK